MKRVLIVEDLPQVAEHLKGMLLRENEMEIVGVQSSSELALQVVSSEKPDVAMVDALLQDKKIPPFELVKRIRALSPGTRLVVVTVPQRPVTPRPEEGIDAVFTLPGGANELEAAIGQKDAKLGSAEVIAVFSAKGGAGKTTIALNLACHLRRNGATVVLVDAVMQFGSVRRLVQTPAEARSIIDLPPGPGMGPALPEALWEGPGGIGVLLAPPRPEQAELVASAELANAVGLLARKHQYVIVDTPSGLSEDALAVLDIASIILVVVTYDPAGLANTRAALDTFEMLGYPGRKKILVVMNRADVTGGLARGSVEHELNLPITAELPSDQKIVPEAAVKQMPFVLSAPTAPVSQAMVQLGTAILAAQRK